MGRDFPNFDKLLKDLEKATYQLFEGLAEVLTGPAEQLRDGTECEPVQLPRDLAAHRNAQTEWWYYTGHCKTESNKDFGFELVFFKRRTDLDKFGLVPLRLIGNPIYFAHFAITDLKDLKFRYAHRKSANNPFDLPSLASESHFLVRIGDWSARESIEGHLLRANLGDIAFEATLKPLKPAVLNGEKLDGVSFKDHGEASRYFSYTRMQVEGFLIEKGKVEKFTGSAWMDREFGTWTPTEKQKGWDWFSVQLDNNCELMCYQLRDSKNQISEFSCGTYVDEKGSSFFLSNKDFEIKVLDFWTSPHTKTVYPNKWQIKLDKFGVDLIITPFLQDQELDTRGTTMIVYWEGACKVEGSPANGKAYVELVGYDRSHESPNLAYFLMGNEFATS